MPSSIFPNLLDGVRIIELTSEKLESTARFLADMGAEVIRVEPVQGALSRQRGPFHDGISLHFAVRNANKRSVALDLCQDADRQSFWHLLECADIWIEGMGSKALADFGVEVSAVRNRFPWLVVVSISDFGLSGPYKELVATDPVHLALGTQLSRSGLPGQPPLLPPLGMSHETSAMQAAWATLNAFYNHSMTGKGDHVDFSIYEATLEVLDPPIGTIGTANSAAQTNAQTASRLYALGDRGRPNSNPYPILPCRDGYVRVIILASRQWRNMRAWLGEPEEFLDPRFDSTFDRHEARDELYRLYAELFCDRTMDELAHDGQERGIPIAPVWTPAQVLEAEHFKARGAFVSAEIAPGLTASVPSGFIEVDGARIGHRQRAPEVGEHNAELLGDERRSRFATQATSQVRRGLPLMGIRVVDFGVVVYGAEVGRIMADMGAEVIKIEDRGYPDGTRMAIGSGPPVSAGFAVGHRNEKSFGLDLRQPEGADVLKRLVRASDVVLSNFKPGTLEGLGLGYDSLREINPQIIWMSASGYGHTGPWSTWRGYGPLVRASSGLASLWRYEGQPDGFGEPTTTYPDHYSARISASAVVGALIRRNRIGVGAEIRLSQSEAVINQIADVFVQEALNTASVPVTSAVECCAPWGVYPCAGDDEWCVITVRDEAEWAGFVRALGSPEWTGADRFSRMDLRTQNRRELDENVALWTQDRTSGVVMERLQAFAIPAGRMTRISDLADDPQLRERDFVAWLEQPGYEDPLPMENRPFHSTEIDAPPLRPAPAFGQDTEWVCAEILGMDPSEIAKLLEAGILEV